MFAAPVLGTMVSLAIVARRIDIDIVHGISQGVIV